MRTVYLNGDYLPESEANISIFDRGFLFADAVYEVVAVLDGKLLEFSGHVSRLRRSLAGLGMGCPVSDEALLDIHRQLVQRNGLQEGLVYLQVTRGVADRDFLFPPADTPQTLVMFTQAKNLLGNPQIERGLKIISVEDLRWGRCDLKTVQLLYPSLMKMEANRRGADDAWMLRDGFITEGTSNNAYIISKAGKIITRSLDHAILAGITRASLLAFAQQEGLLIEERSFSLEEALQAQEAFITAASGFVIPVVSLDGQLLGDGQPGVLTRRLRELYIRRSRELAV